MFSYFCYDLSSDAFDTEELLRVMDHLKHGEAVDIPKYDFKSYKSDALRRVYLWNLTFFSSFNSLFLKMLTA